MKKKTALLAAAVLLLCVLVLALAYTRPRSIEERCPALDLSECVGIHGYYRAGVGDALHSFSIHPGEEDFEEMITLFREASFRTRLRNLLPSGTKIHTGEGFQWDISFEFEGVPFMKDGSMLCGDVLTVNNFFGDLELRFIDGTTRCSVSGGDAWLKQVLEIAERHTD